VPRIKEPVDSTSEDTGARIVRSGYCAFAFRICGCTHYAFVELGLCMYFRFDLKIRRIDSGRVSGFRRLASGSSSARIRAEQVLMSQENCASIAIRCHEIIGQKPCPVEKLRNYCKLYWYSIPCGKILFLRLLLLMLMHRQFTV